MVEIHREEREVELADRSRLPYDALVLATGSIPTLPPIRGLVRIDGRLDERVHAFRSLDDCLRLDAAVSTGSTTGEPGGRSWWAVACSASRSPGHWGFAAW